MQEKYSCYNQKVRGEKKEQIVLNNFKEKEYFSILKDFYY